MKNKTGREDLWGEEIFVGDIVKVGTETFEVKYGNYTFLGVDRIGLYLDVFPSNPHSVRNTAKPLIQAKTIVKIKHEAIYN